MAQLYSYKARGQSGQVLNGNLEAASREDAANQLRERNLYAVSIKAVESGGERKESRLTRDINLSEFNIFGGGYKISELANFAQRLSVLITAGIPIVRSITIIKKQSNSKHEKNMLEKLLSRVEAGETLSSALKEHPKYFPKLFIHLIKAGETGGVLDEVLSELVEYYRERDKTNKQVKSALYYPIVIVIVAVIAVFILIGFVLPNILKMLVNFGGEIPLPTKILIFVSNIISSYWWAILIVLLAGLFLLSTYIKTPKGKLNKDKLLLKIPVIGDLIRKVVIARFASTMALLIKSGVNIINALPVIEEVVDNEVFADVLLETRMRVREGSTLSEPIRQSGEFPPMVVQMLKVGEESGNIEDMLNKISDYYDMEVANAIEGSISLIEPVMIIVLAVIVGGIVASVILPLFSIYSNF
ncbi:MULTISPECIES: type II secretion system F family protein [Halanaerobium]|jgi:type IV pilus assembly protein PilC|uniref:Type IV pilus assembly protein PilC n=1 Tax=Halanaerobium congolense TaxID=54121 RepID=A0A318DW20_9FIRM|nr:MULTISPECIES: type II secretion system F family protein [Halanaerobium]PUU88124.1 MAG: type IV pilus assembly protein PilC [Halanaerobium sp.]PXV61154.1 type IV pilus assembly protein PilC [Halanaerobium congolense]